MVTQMLRARLRVEEIMIHDVPCFNLRRWTFLIRKEWTLGKFIPFSVHGDMFFELILLNISPVKNATRGSHSSLWDSACSYARSHKLDSN